MFPQVAGLDAGGSNQLATVAVSTTKDWAFTAIALVSVCSLRALFTAIAWVHETVGSESRGLWIVSPLVSLARCWCLLMFTESFLSTSRCAKPSPGPISWDPCDKCVCYHPHIKSKGQKLRAGTWLVKGSAGSGGPWFWTQDVFSVESINLLNHWDTYLVLHWILWRRSVLDGQL